MQAMHRTITRDKTTVLTWDHHGLIDHNTIEQAFRTARVPVTWRHLCLMPDAHVGYGATIGSVIATTDAVIPSAVGVDIGCGIAATPLIGLETEEIMPSLPALRQAIQSAVPVGKHTHDNGRHYWHRPNAGPGFEMLDFVDARPDILSKRKHDPETIIGNQFGTLGGGNHFIEIDRDESGCLWLTIHSGSRGIGQALAVHYVRSARNLCEKFRTSLPDPQLAFLPDGTSEFHDYMEAASWAQNYAAENRAEMTRLALQAIAGLFPSSEPDTVRAFDCRHNYVARENHFRTNVWITRKGAARAREGDPVIVPGSMGTPSYIARGRGNPLSYHSTAHGAGRAMSRSQAKKQFTLREHREATASVECRKDDSILDETPASYKDIHLVMDSQKDLVDVQHVLHPLLNIKG